MIIAPGHGAEILRHSRSAGGPPTYFKAVYERVETPIVPIPPLTLREIFKPCRTCRSCKGQLRIMRSGPAARCTEAFM